MASPTVLIFSAWSSGMVISNSSSSSMTSSTMSRESAPMSSWKEVERVTCSLFTPRFSQTISMTRSSTEGTVLFLPGGGWPPRSLVASGSDCFATGYVPQSTHDGQAKLPKAQVKSVKEERSHTQWGKIQGEARKGKREQDGAASSLAYPIHLP